MRVLQVWVFTLEEEDPSSHGIVTDLLVKMTRSGRARKEAGGVIGRVEAEVEAGEKAGEKAGEVATGVEAEIEAGVEAEQQCPPDPGPGP